MKHNKKAIKLLESLGFVIDKRAMRKPLMTGIHGNKPAEPVNLFPHHFTPAFRHVFVGKAVGGYYCTSHIRGELRLFRQHKCNAQKDADVCNVFGHGTTELAAVQSFAANFPPAQLPPMVPLRKDIWVEPYTVIMQSSAL